MRRDDIKCQARSYGFVIGETWVVPSGMRHPQGATVCVDGTRTVFELKRTSPGAVEAAAELFAPDGTLVKAATAVPLTAFRDGISLQMGGRRSATIESKTRLLASRSLPDELAKG